MDEAEICRECASLAAQLADRIAKEPAPIRLIEEDTQTREQPGAGSALVGRRVVLCATLLNPPICQMAEMIEDYAGAQR